MYNEFTDRISVSFYVHQNNIVYMCSTALPSRNANKKKCEWVKWLLWFQRCETGKINTEEAKNHVRKILFVSTAIWKDMAHINCVKRKNANVITSIPSYFLYEYVCMYACVCVFFFRIFSIFDVCFSFTLFLFTFSLLHYAVFTLHSQNVDTFSI